MITRPKAFELLHSVVKEERKITHAIQVAEMMENIAGQFRLARETQQPLSDTATSCDLDAKLLQRFLYEAKLSFVCDFLASLNVAQHILDHRQL